uniref:peptidylprolyl isomerase n=1 Tax=Helianthus annuus TaxID=4232 RepID=A0A251THW7_HELAN
MLHIFGSQNHRFVSTKSFSCLLDVFQITGKGTPIRQVLGKSKMILGLLEGIPTMLKGEVAVLKMKPELHYGEDDCPVSVSDSFPKDAELNFEIELIEFSKIKDVTEDLGILKKVINEAQSWENPRDLYEVKARVLAKAGDGQPLQLPTTGEPIMFTFGKSEVPKGLQMGIGTMSRGEKAVIYVTSQYLSQSPPIPFVEGIEEVHFEVDLIHFIQVRDVLGDGRLIKRHIRDGKGIDTLMVVCFLIIRGKGKPSDQAPPPQKRRPENCQVFEC